jgi:hypothetical protein
MFVTPVRFDDQTSPRIALMRKEKRHERTRLFSTRHGRSALIARHLLRRQQRPWEGR